MIEVYDYEGFVRALAVLVPAVWVWIGIGWVIRAVCDERPRFMELPIGITIIVFSAAALTSALVSWHLAAQSGATI